MNGVKRQFLAIACLMAFSAWSQTAKGTPKLSPAIIAEVKSCIKRLGADTYKDREAATKRLLEIATIKVFIGGVKKYPYKRYVRNIVVPLYKCDDPEVSERAKTIARRIPSRLELLLRKLPSGPPNLHHAGPVDIQAIEEMYSLEPVSAEYFTQDLDKPLPPPVDEE